MHYLKEKICYKEGGTSTNIDNENDENNAESKNINEYNNVEDAPTKGSENLGRGNDQAEDDKETNKRLRGNDDKDINNLGSKKIKQTDISEEDNKNDMEEKCDKLNIIDKNGEIEKSINYKNYAISNKKSEKENFYSEQKFEDLDICDALKKGLKELNFITLTEIQSKCIPHFLNGKDILGAAKTGSGKTLAFLVPSINILYNIKFLPKNGTGVLIISPTRELCLQIYQVCTGLCKYIPQTNGIIIGGVSRNEEKKKFIHGINILIATPGRLLDHMQNTKEFNYKNLLCLIIDEADRLLQIGFEEEINLIVKRLPKKRQTALFSATQTTKVESLIRLSLQKPIFIEVTTKIATVERLQQGYALVDEDKRFLLLFTFLKRNTSKKIMVFFNNCMSVQFYNDLLNYIDIPTFCIHGKKKQNQRLKSFNEFSAAKNAILLCTNVAARGLDIPNVNYIIQYDPPDDSKEYIHRVGRTCRGNDSAGSAIIFLMKHELKFLNYLKFYNIPVNQFSYDQKKLINIQSQMESIVTKNFHLHKMAREAFKSYLNGYVTYALKDVFDINNLNLMLTSKNFGLDTPPKVDLNLKFNAKKKKFK
ncbi:ATP-dependent RNA helicase HAS1, putative [Plasmodium berghei]|uniref:ATP-dependent RNA helicase n=2 Tax=Plasmodium berghei TaxID=5821 RepID=A0A509APR3_PLABA|nr:ATP-dependent RNA helicase HAS1, putative [Plasmodium berghei ANKA]CXI66290.1 ATP-dependent RNA helicase HAS1, putative [Plasmodium berghei]SCM24024.1 ATP-dependent RNA helicase HAS1, putative [Plasmodium berghei]SCN26888.1 ATP-dependent RNA helicase HAS1, putative [Plasmodium berghei]SCO61298.1 ATP-dependent RNA helicase HAS1, putative [Plasmodium berghei]SCO63309.1 ATP-dependent RNA helicase HAS1, putative [Plasmodium berghei]|eukprot:XP_034422504.1 ATP-dependent RNA helicase HAS1, putative [Plasmodium berghei ANKA]